VKPLLHIGYIARAHGLRGEVILKTFDPQSTAINEVDVLVLGTRAGETLELTLASVGESPGSDLLLKFEGRTRREDVANLVGSSVSVRREDLEPPAEGEFFMGDLVGLEVVSVEGKKLGVVHEIWSSGPVPNLVIRDGDAEQMIPYAEEFISKIDLEAKQITVIPPVYEE
jgi:16S rRNA processing protein RimM